MTATILTAPASGAAAAVLARPSLRSRLISGARARFWSGAFTLLGSSINVTGPRPTGPCVLVANHSSHADTPALLGALGGAAAPTVAAASDYWFVSPPRRAVCRALIGGFPVRRGNGGSADLAGAAAHLRAGRSVVVFAEGTRSRDGELARFRSGAFGLAADAGVPVVPVALLGTRDMLPAHGKFRPAPIEVRFGEPTFDRDPERTRESVRGMLDREPARRRETRAWQAMTRLVHRRRGLALLAAWGFAEALVWPVMAEFAIVCAVAAARTRRVPALVGALATGSVAGIAVNILLARHGIALPAPWTTGRMRDAAANDVSEHGVWALARQLTDGIPVKVYAQAFGQTHLPVWQVATVAAVTRTARMALVAGAAALVARLTRRVLPSCYGAAAVVFAAAFFAGLALVESSWR